MGRWARLVRRLGRWGGRGRRACRAEAFWEAWGGEKSGCSRPRPGGEGCKRMRLGRGWWVSSVRVCWARGDGSGGLVFAGCEQRVGRGLPLLLLVAACCARFEGGGGGGCLPPVRLRGPMGFLSSFCAGRGRDGVPAAFGRDAITVFMRGSRSNHLLHFLIAAGLLSRTFVAAALEELEGGSGWGGFC